MFTSGMLKITVTTCYYNSNFVGKAAALNMYEPLKYFLHS